MADQNQEAHARFIFKLGIALAAWQFVEREFLFCLDILFQASPERSRIFVMYEAAQEITKKVSILNRLLEFNFQNDQEFLKQEWKPIYKDFRSNNTDRNHLVHWAPVGMPHFDGSPQAGQVEWFLTRSIADPTNMQVRGFPLYSERLTESDLDAMAIRFGEYQDRIRAFREKAQRPVPSP